MQRTQTELAELLYVTRDAIASWESGRRRIPRLVLEVVQMMHAMPEYLQMRQDWQRFCRDGGPVVSYRRIDSS